MKMKKQEEFYPVELSKELYENFVETNSDKASLILQVDKKMYMHGKMQDYLAHLAAMIAGHYEKVAEAEDAAGLDSMESRVKAAKYYKKDLVQRPDGLFTARLYDKQCLYYKYKMCRQVQIGGQPVNADGTLKGAFKTTGVKYSCKDPMCPACSKVRANKRERYYTEAIDELSRAKVSRDGGNGYRYLRIGLDIGPSCQGYELAEELKKLKSSVARLTRWSRLQKVIKIIPWSFAHPDASTEEKAKHGKEKISAYIMGYEITKNKDTGLYHPHVHMIFVVNPSYFVKRSEKTGYINRADLLEKWREIMDRPEITNVDIGEAKSIHQALKYAVKGATTKEDGDNESLWTWDENKDMITLEDVHTAIEGQKMFVGSQALAQRAKALAKKAGDDPEDEDTDTQKTDEAAEAFVLQRKKDGKFEATEYLGKTTIGELVEAEKSRKAELKAAAESRKEAKLNQSEYARQRAASGQERLQDIKDRAAAGDYAAKAALGQAQARQYERTRRKEMDAADRISDEDAKELAYKLIEETYYNKPCTAVNLQVKYKFGKRQSKKLAELIEKLKKGE